MVFYHYAVQTKNRVVVFILVDGNVPFLVKQGVCFLLSSVKPDIQIATRSVVGYRVIQTHTVPFE